MKKNDRKPEKKNQKP